MSGRYSVALAVTLVAAALAGDAAAQPLGTFRWQLQPYCNVVTFVVTQNGGVYNLDGDDDQCGAATRAPATGTATFNPNGTVAFGFSIVVTPGGSPVHVAAAINVATLSGTWRDHTGASGTFVFTPGASAGGNPRPVATTAQAIPNAFVLRTDGGFLATGTFGSGAIPSFTGGTRMMWYPGRSAFRAGTVTASVGAESNIGTHSAAFGVNTVASGEGSFAAGMSSEARGAAAVAFGGVSRALGIYAFAAGTQNNASAYASVALGGFSTASGNFSFVTGASSIAAAHAAVAMGDTARASAVSSVAIGSFVSADAGAIGAVVLGSHAVAGNIGGDNVASGTFIFGDRSTSNELLSLGRNEFLMRVAGGVRIFTSANLLSGVTVAAGGGSWSSLSDANAKENFRALDGAEVLAKIARLPIREWNYKTQDAAIRHVGPTAQDFRAAFGLGEDATRISSVDADGIALSAVQALEARTRAADDRVRLLEEELATLRERLTQLEALLVGKR